MAGRIVRSMYSSAVDISRGKILNLKQNSIEKQIILVVTVIDKSNTEVEVCLQIYPVDTKDNLPSGLSVKLLDESGNICLQAEAQNADDWIKLEFDCQRGEDFSLQISG